MKIALKFLVVGLLTASLAGCAARRQTSAQAPVYVPPPRPIGLPPGAIVVPPPQGAYQGPPNSAPYAPPQYQDPTRQPGGFPAAPPGASGPSPFPTAPSTNPGYAPPPMSSNPPGPNEALDRVGYRWQPNTPPAATLPLPPPPSSPPSVLLLPPQPETSSSSASPEPPRNDPKKQLYPPQEKKEPINAASSFPVGIPGFDRARDGVATGQRPTIEGLDWLQKAGYRNIVFLHLPGETVDVDRQQIEKRGMIFVPLEINPRQLNREVIELFLRVQRDSSMGKVFVYDLEGSIAGGMWYLTFRVQDQDSEDVARIKARSLGLREERDGAQREMWQAVRRYLDEK